MKNVLCSLAVLALATSCVNEHEPFEELIADHSDVFAAQDDALIDELTVDADGYGVTPVLASDATFNRVAFRFDAAASAHVQVRVSSDGETFGAWTDAQITFQEEGAHNAQADVPEGSTHAQLRFLAPVEAGLSFLAVDLFDYVAPLEDESIVQAESSTAEQGLAADGVAVTRSQWGARNRTCNAPHSPNRLTIHHTVSPNNDSMSMPARMRQIQAFHIDGRGWCDIGYHFLIGQDGKVYQGRRENHMAAHAANDNSNNVGISFIGTFTSVAPSSSMMNAGARIMKAMSQTYGITLNRTKVKGHRQVGTTATSCPGDAFYPRLQALVDLARGTPAGGGSGFCAPSRSGSWCDGNAVVTCNNGSQVSRTTCGNGCRVMPAGTPDQCAPPPPPPPPPAQGSYSDVPTSHFAHAAAEKLRARGALFGCAAGSFCPNAPITRGQLAHIFAVLETSNVSLTGVPSFTDVPTSHSLRAVIRETVARGIMQQCAPGQFCPADPVSRAAGAVFTRRARDLADHNPATPTYGDVGTNHWAASAIERLTTNNIVSGCQASPRMFCPADDLTRAQAAVIIARAYGL